MALIEITCKHCGTMETIEQIDEVQDEFDLILFNIAKDLIDRSVCGCCSKKITDEWSAKQNALKSRDESNIPFDDFDRTKSEDNGKLAEWVWKNKKSNMFLAGMYGCGKTRAISNALYHMLRNGQKVKYIRANEFFNHHSTLSSENSKDVADGYLKQLLCGHDAIVVDDLGKKKVTEANGEALYNLLDMRYNGTGKAKIWLTANKSANGLKQRFEDRDVAEACISRLTRMEFKTYDPNQQEK